MENVIARGSAKAKQKTGSPPREVDWMPPLAGQMAPYRTEVQWPMRLSRAGVAPEAGTADAK